MLAVVADPDNPEYEEPAVGTPPGYDPAAFDVDETTAAMQSPTRVAGW